CKACYRDCEHARRAKIKAMRKPNIAHKNCSCCQQTKPVSDFSRCISKPDGYSSRCKQCRKERETIARMTRLNGKIKARHLKGHYGMSTEDLVSLLDSQGGRCAICETDLVRPCIDHDHATGAIRGSLCFHCNSLLRAFEDPDFVSKAFRYLAHHSTPKTPWKVTPYHVRQESTRLARARLSH
ncbi:hypothetical protein LCGC14_2135570, partial [marine sediment metagenome]